MLKNKIRPSGGSWQEFNLSVRSSEGLFIKLARSVQLGRSSLSPGTWCPQSSREGHLGSPGPCHCSERHPVSQADSHTPWTLVAAFILCWGRGKVDLAFFPFAEDIILKKNVQRIEMLVVNLFYCQ